MASLGDKVIVVSVNQQDIDNSTVSNDYTTSLGLAIIRQVNDVNSAGFNIVSTKMGLVGSYGAAVYDLDLLSISFCNLERLGIKVTIPYSATLTLAQGLV